MRKAVIVLLLGLVLAGCDVFDQAAQNEYAAAAKTWNTGDYPTATRMYFTLAKEHPYSSRADDALYWAGVTQFLYLGQTDQALETLRLLLKRYPHRDMAPQAQWYIAQIYDLGYSDYKRAIVEYRKAVLYSNPEVKEKSLYSLADCLLRVGKVDEARQVWIKQVTEFPHGPNVRLAYYRLGTAAFSKGDLEKAKMFYRQAIENNSDSSLVLKAKFALAGCLEDSGQLDEALKLYQQLAPVYPNKEAIEIKIKAIQKRIIKKSY